LNVQNGTWFDAEAVSVAEGFIATLTLTKSTRSGEPEPFKLLPHSRKLIANIVGWKREDGRRLIRKVFATMGRKQAKTQTAAALVLVEFFLNPEPKQEIYMAATDTDQAAICFEAVYDMIVASPDLEALVDITLSQRKIRHRETGSIIRVLSSDGKRKHGYNPSMVVFDELHAWGPAQAELYAALTTGSKSRKQPLRVIITTAGSDQETICYREYEYAKRILAGEITDESYFPLIYEVSKDADWTDQSLWRQALPLLDSGHHSLKDYEEEFNQAMARPDLQNQFRRLYLNQWTSSETQWIPIHEWDGCAAAEPIDWQELRRYPCYGGLDLAAVHDLTAFSLCWPVGSKVYYRTWAFLPSERLADRSKRDGVPYDRWAKDGHILLTPGTTTDWRYVTAKVKELAKEYDIRAIAFDRYGARDTVRELQEAGLDVIDFGQGYQSMSPACRRFEKLIYDRALQHEGSPLIRWCVDCTQITQAPGDLIKPVKPERMRNNKRIDPVISMTMATGIAIITTDERSIWETRGRPI
jgi:phage terminase large subunit-like protein